METYLAIDMARQAIVTTAVLVAPALLIALLVGCITGVLQAATQIQDQSISFVPKLLAIGGTILLCLPWMVEYFLGFARHVITNISLTSLGG